MLAGCGLPGRQGRVSGETAGDEEGAELMTGRLGVGEGMSELEYDRERARRQRL